VLEDLSISILLGSLLGLYFIYSIVFFILTTCFSSILSQFHNDHMFFSIFVPHIRLYRYEQMAYDWLYIDLQTMTDTQILDFHYIRTRFAFSLTAVTLLQWNTGSSLL
jgi:hypothetical protein